MKKKFTKTWKLVAACDCEDDRTIWFWKLNLKKKLSSAAGENSYRWWNKVSHENWTIILTSWKNQLEFSRINPQDLSFYLPENKNIHTDSDFMQNNLRGDTSTSSQVANCDGVMLEIYLDHKFQWPQESVNCESLAYKFIT